MRKTKKARADAVVSALIGLACTIGTIEKVVRDITGLSEEKVEGMVAHWIAVALPVALLGILIAVATWSFFQLTAERDRRAKVQLLALVGPIYLYFWVLLIWAMGILAWHWWMTLWPFAWIGLGGQWRERPQPMEGQPDQRQ